VQAELGSIGEEYMRSTIGLVLIGLIGGGIGVLVPSGSARANCYELIGCSNADYYLLSDLMKLGCQPLWEVRNWIYKENDYCFHTPKAIKAFGNAGCLYDDAAQVPLNTVEQANLETIKRAEANKGCQAVAQ
jgi:YARHG domain